MTTHQQQWSQIQSSLMNQRLAQSLLFVGPLHCGLSEFTIQVIQLIVCKQKTNAPCLQCIDCRMIKDCEHPDLEWIKPEKEGGAIKVDQIRALQHSAYLTPQRAKNKIIVIEAADRMNTASANALLKILEEPTQYTNFILLAQQLSTVLPTILSRCQKMSFSSLDDLQTTNLLEFGHHYSPKSERAKIISEAEQILNDLIALIECREHPCVWAAKWNEFELSTMLWFLYLVYSQLQHMYIKKDVIRGPAAKQLSHLMTLLNPLLIFRQLDKINGLLRKINSNITVNHSLVLEDLLFGLSAVGGQ